MEFSDDYLEAVLKKSQSAAKLLKVLKAENGEVVEVGENYMSDIRKLKLKVRCQDGQIRNVAFIVKVFPKEAVKRTFIEEGGLFNREIKMYRDILPAMEKLLDDNEVYCDKLWARCFDFASNKFLMFEDLSALGYKLADRKRRLDFDHSLLAFGALARFHALSVVSRDKHLFNPSEFDQFVFCLENNDTQRRFYDSGLSAMIDTIRNHWGNDWLGVADDLETLLTKVNDKFLYICKRRDSDFNVLCHGDPWTNNMLFKYCPYSGKPVGIKFLDFQCCHYRSYGVDLNYTIYTSVQGKVREERLDDLLKVYHQSLVSTFERCHYVPSNLPTFEDVKSEVERLKFFGVVIISAFLHIYTSDKENVVDFEELDTNTNYQVPKATLLSQVYTETGQNILNEFKNKKFFSLVVDEK